MSQVSLKKQKIITQAILIIETDGLDKLTYAKIAKASKLKIDTIKSIFKDMDSLVDSVYKKTLRDEFVNSLKIYKKKYQHNSKLFLSKLMHSILNGLLEHPRILKAHFYPTFVYQDTNTTSIALLRNFTDEVLKIILGKNPEPTVYSQTKIRLQQSISSILFIGLFKDVFTSIDKSLWLDNLTDYILSVHD